MKGENSNFDTIPYKVIAYYFYKILHGELAQLGARLTGSQKVRGSNPLFSTIKRTEKSVFLFMIFTTLGNILAVNARVLLPNICDIYLNLVISVAS